MLFLLLKDGLGPMGPFLWKLFLAWWWVPLPFLLWKPAVFMWLWWRNELWLNATFKPVLLEIKMPKEVLKPIRAMENVLAGIHQATWEPPNWMEKWWEGQVQMGESFEITSIGGDIHFYIRCHKKYRDPIESNIYSQFPGVEIAAVEDYTKNVPRDIPNKDWNFWATDYRFLKPDCYPLLTYKSFETEQEALEEKRIDPVSQLLESLSKIKPGEQFWFQILFSSIGEKESDDIVKEGNIIRDRLAQRPEKAKPKSFLQQATEIALTGAVAEEVKEEQIIPSEMRMTPGEREIVEGIEAKLSRPLFRCSIRYIFMGKRDVWFKPNNRLGFGFLANYNTLNLNSLQPYGKTMTKVKSKPIVNLLDKRRMYLRQRKIFRRYCDRDDSFYPRFGKYPTIFVLNTEELASIFHFPSWQVSPVPGVPRVEYKKGAPPNLPVE